MSAELQKAKEFFQALIHQHFLSHPVEHFEICESHLAFVFLTGPFAYKLRKPKKIDGLVDYSTPERRGHFLSLEFGLNQEFGHDIYRQLIPVHQDSAGLYNSEGRGPALDFLLQMKQMPSNSLLSQHLETGNILTPSQIADLAAVLSSFHRRAKKSTATNVKFLNQQVHLISDFLRLHEPTPQMETLLFRFHEAFEKRQGLFSRRAAGGFLREIHGDFRSENVFFTEGKFYPFNRIEFSLDYRTQDLLCDVAALSTDFLYFDRPQTRRQFLQYYGAQESGAMDEYLLAFYEFFWALVNAYVAVSLRNQHAGLPSAEVYQKKLQRYLHIAQAIQG